MVVGKNDDSIFFSNFLGEYVEALLKHNYREKATALPIAIRGYLIDYDDDMYYLGESPERITQAVPKSLILHLSIVKVNEVYNDEDEFEKILNSLDPKSENEIN